MTDTDKGQYTAAWIMTMTEAYLPGAGGGVQERVR